MVDGVMGNRPTMTLTDLAEDTNYYFKVQALDKSGYGPMSSMLVFRTPKSG